MYGERLNKSADDIWHVDMNNDLLLHPVSGFFGINEFNEKSALSLENGFNLYLSFISYYLAGKSGRMKAAMAPALATTQQRRNCQHSFFPAAIQFSSGAEEINQKDDAIDFFFFRNFQRQKIRLIHLH